jgi:hypothetical protein
MRRALVSLGCGLAACLSDPGPGADGGTAQHGSFSKLALFGLVAALGCGPDGIEEIDATTSCLVAQAIEPGICRVLPTGLVVREQDDVLVAGMLLEDGTIAPLGTLPAALDCSTALAHDPEAGKLWWSEPSEATLPARVHQLDLASGGEDWQRELSYAGFSHLRIHSLLFHDGSLFLAGRAWEYQPISEASVLARWTTGGETSWTQIGQIGFGVGNNETQAMHGANTLLAIDGAVAFVGNVEQTDPEDFRIATTLATADLATGDLLTTTLVERTDPQHEFLRVDGRGDLLVTLVGQWDWVNDIRTNNVARSSLGEELWRVDMTWPGFVATDLSQVLLHDRIVHIATEISSFEAPDLARTRVVERSHAGEVLCDGTLPELDALGQPSYQSAWGVRGDRIVLTAGFEDVSEVAWVLRSKP